MKSLKELFSKAKSAVTNSEEAVEEISPQPKLRLAPERTDIDPVSGVCVLCVLCTVKGPVCTVFSVYCTVYC